MVLYQNGNAEAFQALYDRHAGKIFGFIKTKIKKEEQARDIFQESFSKIHKSKHLYSKSFPLLPWIFTIVRNVLIDSVRKENSRPHTEFDLDTLATPEMREVRSMEKFVNPLLTNLSESQKTAIQMRYIEEKTFEEIADHLRTSTLNVRQLISRGVKRLKGLIGDGHEQK